MQAYWLAGFAAPAVLVTAQSLQRLIDFVEKLLLPFQEAQLPPTLFLSTPLVGQVAEVFRLAQPAEFLLDAVLQLGSLVKQALAEKRLLHPVHVSVYGHGKQFGFADHVEFRQMSMLQMLYHINLIHAYFPLEFLIYWLTQAKSISGCTFIEDHAA